MVQRLFAPFSLTDIHVGADHSLRNTVPVANDRGAGKYVYPPSVLVAHSEFSAESVRLSGHATLDQCFGSCLAIGICKVFPRRKRAFDFVLSVAEH